MQVRRALGYAWPYRRLWRAFGQSKVSPPIRRRRSCRLPSRAKSTTPLGGRSQARPIRPRRSSLLHDAGYERGEFRIDFAYLRSEPTGTIIATALRRAGFDAVPDREADPREAGRDRVRPSLAAEHQHPAVPARTGRAARPGSQRSSAASVGPDVDREIARVQALPLDQQAAAWGALDQTIETDDYPVIPTGHGGVANLRGSRIGGLHLDSLLGTPTFKDIYVLPVQEG